jgi:PAS domain S-box-containing protein
MKFWFGKKETEQGAVSCDVVTIPNRDPELGVTHSSSILISHQGEGLVSGSGVSMPQPPIPQGAARAEMGSSAKAGGVSETPEAVAEEKPLQPAVAPSELPKKPAQPAAAEKVAAMSVQAPVNRMQAGLSGYGSMASAEPIKTGRPVMTPVRMATPTAPVRLTPVSTAPVAAPAPVPVSHPAAVPAARPAPMPSPAFGLRPKEGAAGGAAPAAAALATAAPKTISPAAAAVMAPASAPVATAAEKGVVERDADGVVRPKNDQRALYYQLMNGLYDAVLILDDQGHIVDCNTRVTVMLGYSREETWDIPIEKVITGMSSQMFEHLKRNLAENHHILIDARCFRQDGTSFAGEVGVSTLSLTRGSNIVFAIRNVDRRKNAMDEMRKGHAALEIALTPAFVCDLDGFFLIVNQALLDAFGIPDETQAKNVRFIDLLPDAARFFLRASCGEKLRETLRVPTPNGVPLKVEIALKPVQNGQTVTAVAGSILQA